jgi:hypothetical protein
MPTTTIVVAFFICMASATHMRAEETVLRTGLWRGIGDFFKDLFKAEDAWPPLTPPVKAEVPAIKVDPQPPPVKVDPQPPPVKVDPRPPPVKVNTPTVPKPLPNGRPPLIPRPKEFPIGTSIVKLSNADTKLLYQQHPRFMLSEFKKLSPRDQARFNTKIKLLRLGPPLIPRPPDVKIPLFRMEPQEVKKLMKEHRSYAIQEFKALSDSNRKKLLRKIDDYKQIKKQLVTKR